MRPLRILQCGPTRHRGGVAVAIEQLCIGLAREGQEVLLFGNGVKDRRDALVDAGVRYEEYGNWEKGLTALLSASRRVRALMKEFQPDVVHVHGRGPSLLFMIAGRKPDWFTLHSSHLTEHAGILDVSLIRKFLSPTARRIFIICEEAREYVITRLGFDSSDVVFVQNGIDCTRFRCPEVEEREKARRVFEVGIDEILVLFMGRFHHHKSPGSVLNLAKVVRDAGLGNVKFALVGGGVLEEELNARIADANLEEICYLSPWRDPVEAYWASDLLVMPSPYEGFGLVGAEAMACGCPVLRTRTGGCREMIDEGITGFGCSCDEESFIKTGLRVLKESQKLKHMHDAARAKVVGNLSLDRQARCMIDVYWQHIMG